VHRASSLSAGNHRCDTLIYSHDFAGVTFAGVQALIRENVQLRAQLQGLQANQQQTDARVRLLETALLGRRQKVALRNR
jgi:cell division protein FtsB